MKVSVVTVNLNGNRYLAGALDSILTQDHPDIELIIIDGCSTDSSLETIRAYALKDKRVRWLTEPDRGIADAMNKGVALAGGELVGFLHSDDFYPAANVISTVVTAFERSAQALWLTGGMEWVDSRGRYIRTFPVRNYSYTWLKRSNILFHPSTFVRAEVLRKYCFDPDLKLAMDYALWLRLGAIADPLLLDCPLAAFRVHEGSSSSRAATAALTEEYVVRRRFLKAHGQWHYWYPLDYFAKRVVGSLSPGH